MTRIELKEPAGLPSQPSLRSEGEWNKLFADQLTSVRKAAENWRTGLVGLLGLVSLFSVVEGPKAADELVAWAIWAAGVAVLASALFAVIGAVAALRAAFGLPRVLTRSQFLSLGGQQGFNLKVADDARADLETAKTFTYMSLATLAIAVGLTWYAPTETADLIEVSTNDGRVVCGSLVNSSDGVMQIDSTTAGSTKVTLSTVKTVEQPSSCDG